jgi:hypothetical protein
MPRTRCFVYVDGREVEAASPLAFFEKLRSMENSPPPDLARYLDLLRARARIFYGLDLDTGLPQVDVHTRCQTALSSLMGHGWVRVKAMRASPVGPQLLLR